MLGNTSVKEEHNVCEESTSSLPSMCGGFATKFGKAKRANYRARDKTFLQQSIKRLEGSICLPVCWLAWNIPYVPRL